MNKTKIEWTDFTSNPIKGKCPVDCDYCYMKPIRKRFHLDPTLRLDEKELYAPQDLAKPSRIFVCSTIEIFHPLIPKEWRERIFFMMYQTHWHTFQVLTKRPEFAYQYYPDNVWLGISMDRTNWLNLHTLMAHTRAKIRFVSFEPLLEEIDVKALAPEGFNELDWIIIGARTQPYRPPEKEWVEAIIEEANRYNIPVFLKDNLRKLMGDKLVNQYRQFPEEAQCKKS